MKVGSSVMMVYEAVRLLRRKIPVLCRVTGGGWDDINAVTIPAPFEFATIETNGKGKPVYSFGGQAWCTQCFK